MKNVLVFGSGASIEFLEHNVKDPLKFFDLLIIDEDDYETEKDEQPSYGPPRKGKKGKIRKW